MSDDEEVTRNYKLGGFTMVEADPVQRESTIEHRVYYSRWRRVWYFIIGRCGYRLQKYENCILTAISFDATDEQVVTHMEFHVPGVDGKLKMNEVRK